MTPWAERKAARRAALAATSAVAPTLRGAPVVVRRPESLEWLRSTPVEEWPPLRALVNEAGETILTDGNHRVAVARELGMAALCAVVRLPDGGVIEARVDV